MSRKRPNRNKREELNKEYKDPEIVGKDTEELPEFKLVENSVIVSKETNEKNPVQSAENSLIRKYLEEKDKDILSYLEKNAIYGTLHDDNVDKTVEVVIAFPIYVKENMDIKSRNLLIKELDERDKEYFYSSADIPFAMAFINPGTIVKAIDMGNGWFKLHKGFIYNGSVYKNDVVKALFAKRGSVTRVADIMREVK